MTQIEAFHFLRKCERFWLWRKNLAVGQVIHRTKQSCLSIIATMLIAVFIAAPHVVNADEVGFWHYLNIFLLVFSFSMIGLSIWLLVRLRQARRALREKA